MNSTSRRETRAAGGTSPRPLRSEDATPAHGGREAPSANSQIIGKIKGNNHNTNNAPTITLR
eukprot:8533564-Heterocapsa_arctica.AAC.1